MTLSLTNLREAEKRFVRCLRTSNRLASGGLRGHGSAAPHKDIGVGRGPREPRLRPKDGFNLGPIGRSPPVVLLDRTDDPDEPL